jgi:hypothetical protein
MYLARARHVPGTYAARTRHVPGTCRKTQSAQRHVSAIDSDTKNPAYAHLWALMLLCYPAT